MFVGLFSTSTLFNSKYLLLFLSSSLSVFASIVGLLDLICADIGGQLDETVSECENVTWVYHIFYKT